MNEYNAIINDYQLSNMRLSEELDRLRDEIRHLREAGDALAQGIRTGRWDDALDRWDCLRGQ
jgi:hypothetical protein